MTGRFESPRCTCFQPGAEEPNMNTNTIMKIHTMKTHPQRRALATVTLLSMLVISGAEAANTLYVPGDLLLCFQQQGGSNTVYVNLGNAASNYRGAAAGAADGVSHLNIVNINSTLVSAYGTNWANDPTIYAGMAGVWGGEPDDESLQNGDPSRTLYVSKARAGAGTIGLANSSGWTINTNTGMTSGAAAIYNQNNAFAQFADAAMVIAPNTVSRIDENNPFTTAGSIVIQSTAFSIFGGGVQQQGSVGDFGEMGESGTVEFALDLYRITAAEGIAGQVPGVLRKGSYEGTVTVNSSGGVSFVAVPEPSSLVLTGLAAGALAFRRRRIA